MIPWHKMPKDLQRAILAMIVCFGGASAGCRLFPVVCDPPPPPSVTPMICDPPPPPPSATPSVTPMICDPPPPPPSVTPTPTLTPMICDPPPPPPSATPTLTPMICDPPPPPNSDASSARPGQSQAPEGVVWDGLPLAEVRTVEIVWQNGFAFAAETPWPGATLTWTATGGTLAAREAQVEWFPPTVPGRYQLQVVADWGARGLAVDAVVVEVEEDGSVVLC